MGDDVLTLSLAEAFDRIAKLRAENTALRSQREEAKKALEFIAGAAIPGEDQSALGASLPEASRFITEVRKRAAEALAALRTGD